MTGPFNPPLVRVQGPADHLDETQRTRAAALLVAQQARPMGTADEHLRLAEYVVHGGVLSTEARNPYQLFGSQQVDLDPVHTPFDNSRIPNFGDLEATEDDGLG